MFIAQLSKISSLTNQIVIPESGIIDWWFQRTVHRLLCPRTPPQAPLFNLLRSRNPNRFARRNPIATWEPVRRLCITDRELGFLLLLYIVYIRDIVWFQNISIPPPWREGIGNSTGVGVQGGGFITQDFSEEEGGCQLNYFSRRSSLMQCKLLQCFAKLLGHSYKIGYPKFRNALFQTNMTVSSSLSPLLDHSNVA